MMKLKCTYIKNMRKPYLNIALDSVFSFDLGLSDPKNSCQEKQLKSSVAK